MPAMPLEQVPSYLIDGVRQTDPDRLAEAMASDDESQALAALEAGTYALAELARDDALWAAASEAIGDGAGEPQAVDQLDLKVELTVLTGTLDGDQRLAAKILVEVPLDSSGADLQRAREIIVVIRNQCEHELAAPKKPSRKWRALRLAKRAFKALGGGLVIAADIVSPDVTGITKVASIVGGIDAITDALPGA